MMADIIVFGSIGLSALFAAAWAVSPPLRAWIERPKHRFLNDVTEYDRAERQRRGTR